MGDTPLQRALREANAELLQRIEELSLVRSVGDALAGAVEPGTIGEALVGLLRDELPADLIGLWAVDELAGGLRRIACVRPDGASVPAAAPVPFSAAPLGTAAAAGSVVHVDDVGP